MKKVITSVAMFLLLCAVLVGCTFTTANSNGGNVAVLYVLKEDCEEDTILTRDMLEEIRVNVGEAFMTPDGKTYTPEEMTRITAITKENFDYYVKEDTVVDLTKGRILQKTDLVQPRYYVYEADYSAGTYTYDKKIGNSPIKTNRIDLEELKEIESIWGTFNQDDYKQYVSSISSGGIFATYDVRLAVDVKAGQVVKKEHFEKVESEDDTDLSGYNPLG